jgi:hypothetical protein
MINLLDINKNISFDENNHIYKNKNGKELISTTTLIKLYEPKFDEYGYIVQRCAKREGITVEQQLNKWKEINEKSKIKGHTFHSEIEHFIKTGKILKGEYVNIIKQFSKIKFKGKLFSEIPIHSDKYYIGGMADLIEVLDNKNNINLGDFKTNKKLDYKSKYKSKLLYPLDNRDNCEFERYTIQMGIYQYMLEEHGFKVKNITIYWLNPQTNKLEIHPVPIIQKDIKKLLNHYQSILEW